MVLVSLRVVRSISGRGQLSELDFLILVDEVNFTAEIEEQMPE